jgi:hypothetical protein
MPRQRCVSGQEMTIYIENKLKFSRFSRVHLFVRFVRF